MKYAHLFKAYGKWELYVTSTPSLVGAALHGSYADKWEAKAAVRALGARPWNF